MNILRGTNENVDCMGGEQKHRATEVSATGTLPPPQQDKDYRLHQGGLSTCWIDNSAAAQAPAELRPPFCYPFYFEKRYTLRDFVGKSVYQWEEL